MPLSPGWSYDELARYREAERRFRKAQEEIARDQHLYGPQDDDVRLDMQSQLADPQFGLAHRAIGVTADGAGVHLNRPSGYQSAQSQLDRRRYANILKADTGVLRMGRPRDSDPQDADRLDALLQRLRR